MIVNITLTKGEVEDVLIKYLQAIGHAPEGRITFLTKVAYAAGVPGEEPYARFDGATANIIVVAGRKP